MLFAIEIKLTFKNIEVSSQNLDFIPLDIYLLVWLLGFRVLFFEKTIATSHSLQLQKPFLLFLESDGKGLEEV
jgi:hypothetical protein